MSEAVGRNLPPKAQEAPNVREILSDEQMGNLLSAIGNHEAKAITLILMRNGNIYRGQDLHREILGAQGEAIGWPIAFNNTLQYCAKSLSPIGLVAKETISEDLSTYGYQITEAGKELGIPFAGLLLDFSEKYNIPLRELFGSTTSSSPTHTTSTDKGGSVEFKKRAPSSTLKIIYELLTTPSLPIREVDLKNATGEAEGHVYYNLIRLAEIGLIQYEAIERNKPISTYKLSVNAPDGKLPKVKKYNQLTSLVFNILKKSSDQYFTAEDICNLLPQEVKATWKDAKTLMHDAISPILFKLSKHSFIDLKKFNSGKMSEINLTENQRAILTKLLETIFRFQNGDEEIIKMGNTLAEEIVNSPQRVASLMRRSRESSSWTNKSSPTEVLQNIRSIITSHPEGLTNEEIHEIYKRDYNPKLGRKYISSLTHSLGKQGLARVTIEGVTKKYVMVHEKGVTS